MAYAFTFFTLFLYLINGHAEEQKEKLLPANYNAATVHQTTTCQVGKIAFTLNLGDDSKEVDEERKRFGFPYFWIVTAKGRSVSAVPPKEYNELLFLTPNAKSICKDTVAFLRPDGGVAIFVHQNTRPFGNNLTVTFYNPKRGKVMAFARSIGYAEKIESIGKELFFPIKSNPTDLATFLVTVGGKKSQASEEVFEYWNKVSRKNEQVIVSVNPDLTWARTIYRPYFKTKALFEKAFGWSAPDKKYAYRWVYRVTSPDCIRVSSTRFADSKNWICK
ncbi:MAG: hypothetical protein WA160_13855 [Pseudobdellovibrio sp.]